ncbi:MAG: hypothetical protein O3B86_15670 [Planctomycetota bacterium]|nr:hypothetical protein [Planctomycetota bacterium]
MITRKYRKATDAERAAMEHAILTAVLRNGRAGTDDAHTLFELPDDAEPRCWGAVLNGLVASGLLVRVGDMHTGRDIAHGRRIGLYEAVDAERLNRHVERLAAAVAQRRPAQMTLPLEEETDPTTEAGSAA